MLSFQYSPVIITISVIKGAEERWSQRLGVTIAQCLQINLCCKKEVRTELINSNYRPSHSEQLYGS